MTYNDIYKAVNQVRACHFKAKNGRVIFELIQEDSEPSLVNAMIDNIKKLGTDYFVGCTLHYKFSDTAQRRTYFRISKA